MNNDKEHQFELLVRQHKRTIYTVCYMFSRNKTEIDDLFQEILIRLWTGFDSYEGRSTAQTWIYRVALNTAINQDKKERRRIETVPLTVDIDPYEADDPKTQQIRELYDRISWQHTVLPRLSMATAARCGSIRCSYPTAFRKPC